MKATTNLFFIGLLSQLLSCNTTGNISEEEKAIISKEIQGRLDGYQNALKRHDMDWFQNFWSNEKDFVFAGDGLVQTNYDSAITQAYGEAFRNIRDISFLHWSNGHALIIDRNTVSYTTNFNWQAIMVSGDTVKAKGAWLYLFRRKDGQWKVVNSAGTHQYTSP